MTRERFPGAQIPAVTLLFLLSLTVFPRAGTAQELYRSNSLGMALEAIPEIRRDEHGWVLERSRENGRIVERLYRNGEMQRRTVRSRRDGKEVTEVWTEDRLLRRMEKRAGRPRMVTEYAPSGAVERSEYIWSNGRLQELRMYSDGGLQEIRRYTTDSQGRLLQVLRLHPDGSPISVTAFQAERGSPFLESEWHTEEERRHYYRFGSEGEIELQRVTRGEDATAVTRYYREDGTLYSETELPEEKGEILRRFDDRRRVVEKTVRREGAVERELLYYSEDHLQRRVVRRAGERREWEYAYDADGNLERRSFSINGRIQTGTEYGEGDIREVTVYYGGEAAVLMRYRGEELVEKRELRPDGGTRGE